VIGEQFDTAGLAGQVCGFVAGPDACGQPATLRSVITGAVSTTTTYACAEHEAALRNAGGGIRPFRGTVTDA